MTTTTEHDVHEPPTQAIKETTEDGVRRAQVGFQTMWHRLAEQYEWVHTLLGVGGNGLFVVGSVLFLWESTKQLGVWLFIVGSALMLIGAVGSALRQANADRGR